MGRRGEGRREERKGVGGKEMREELRRGEGGGGGPAFASSSLFPQKHFCFITPSPTILRSIALWVS